MHGAYFLAEGSKDALERTFAGLEQGYGKPVYGVKGQRMEPIPDVPVPAAVVSALAKLPRAAKVQGKP